MTRDLVDLIPYVVISMIALAAVLFLLALHQLRRGRTGPYWRLRREAGQRGGQLFLIAVALFGSALGIAFFSGFAAVAMSRVNGFLAERSPAPVVIVEQPTETPTPDLSPSAPVTATDTPTPSAISTTDIPTATSTPTITPTPTLTLTPSATYETAFRLDVPANARAPRPDAMINIVAADSAVSPDETPVQPRSAFEAGIRRVYLFINFQAMDDGVAWSRVLYRDGAPVQGSTLLWSLGEAGTSYFFLGNEDGYPPGSYSVEVMIGLQVVTTFEFTVS
jgi:hypothetical protein